jgi:hypothetical protein
MKYDLVAVMIEIEFERKNNYNKKLERKKRGFYFYDY